MRGMILFGIAAWLSVGSAYAESGGLPEGADSAKMNAFANLNASFIRTYSGLAELNQKATRPILITTGATWELLGEDGSVKRSPAPNPVEAQLKAVAHVCAYLYAISELHWRDAKDTKWLDQMKEVKANLDRALGDVDKVSWASDAWPGGEDKLRAFMKQSLTNARDFASGAIAKGDVTPADFQVFANMYVPTIRSAFYLNSLSNAYDLLKVLGEWKKEMGPEAWGRMKVLIAAGRGRSTAGLTKETNPAALVMSAVMEPDAVKQNMLMEPGAATDEDALSGLALALTSNKLADVFKGNADAEWYYSSLKQPDIPVALQPVKTALEDLIMGKAKDPILGLGPK